MRPSLGSVSVSLFVFSIVPFLEAEELLKLEHAIRYDRRNIDYEDSFIFLRTHKIKPGIQCHYYMSLLCNDFINWIFTMELPLNNFRPDPEYDYEIRLDQVTILNFVKLHSFNNTSPDCITSTIIQCDKLTDLTMRGAVDVTPFHLISSMNPAKWSQMTRIEIYDCKWMNYELVNTIAAYCGRLDYIQLMVRAQNVVDEMRYSTLEPLTNIITLNCSSLVECFLTVCPHEATIADSHTHGFDEHDYIVSRMGIADNYTSQIIQCVSCCKQLKSFQLRTYFDLQMSDILTHFQAKSLFTQFTFFEITSMYSEHIGKFCYNNEKGESHLTIVFCGQNNVDTGSCIDLLDETLSYWCSELNSGIPFNLSINDVSVEFPWESYRTLFNNQAVYIQSLSLTLSTATRQEIMLLLTIPGQSFYTLDITSDEIETDDLKYILKAIRIAYLPLGGMPNVNSDDITNFTIEKHIDTILNSAPDEELLF